MGCPTCGKFDIDVAFAKRSVAGEVRKAGVTPSPRQLERIKHYRDMLADKRRWQQIHRAEHEEVA